MTGLNPQQLMIDPSLLNKLGKKYREETQKKVASLISQMINLITLIMNSFLKKNTFLYKYCYETA